MSASPDRDARAAGFFAGRAAVLLRRRLAQALPVILLVLVGNFLLLKLAPGDVIDAYVAAAGGGDRAFVAQLRAEYGLDQPVIVQLGLYLWKAVRLDLGQSVLLGQPVLSLILERLPNTLMLMMSSIGFAFGLGVLLGVAAARRAGRPEDTAIITLGLIVYATPGFWLGLMLIVIFSVRLAWLPLSGIETIASSLTGWERVLDIARHLVLPTASLALVYVAIYMRLMRAGMLEVFGLDFIRTARAKGLSDDRIAYRHVLPNAILPMVTMLGLQFGTLLGGSVVIESVFSIPGIGRLAYEAVVGRDLNLLLGIVFMSALLVIAVNLIVDLLYAHLDPRIESA
ncbi:MAG: ABC transporter permease [Alphaproteobacteria bacterium]|nr:ABC transporter permease [Alphaproteobacteria bacterium]